MWFSQVMAAWHPRLVPFPIVLLLAALVLDLVGLLTGNDKARWAGRWLMLVGTAFLLLAFICGICAEIWAGRAGVPHEQIEFHELAGTIAAWGFIVLTAWRVLLNEQRRGVLAAYVVCGFLLYGFIAATGYRGGQLVQDYGAAVRGAEARTTLSLHDLNILAQRQTDQNLHYSDLMHRSAGTLVLLLTLSLFVKELHPQTAPKLWWVMPSLMLGGGVLLFFFADLDLYRLNDPRQFLDREVQMHKILALVLAGVGLRGFLKRGLTAPALLGRYQNRLVAVMALIGGGALFTHVHTVAPYANVAAGVYINHIVMGAIALAIGAVKLWDDAVVQPVRWRALAFPSLLLVECFLLLTYTESIPWWVGIGHYNRWGPHGGDIAPLGAVRAELVFDNRTGQMDVHVLDRFQDTAHPVPTTTLNLVVSQGYRQTDIPLQATDGENGHAAHFRGTAPFLKTAALFDAHISVPVAGGERTSYFDPWVVPAITGIPPNQVARYICPMHEGIRSAEHGDCQLCGMPLVPVAAPSGQLHDPVYEMELRYANDQLCLTPRRNDTGAVVRDLLIAHEHLLHLIVVSDDLTFFAHVHPVQQPDGSFTLPYQFPRDGHYLLFADILPAGDRNQIFRLPLSVGRAVSAHRDGLSPSAVLAREIGDYHIELTAQPRQFSAGRESQLVFRLERAGKPVLDLEPYIGAMGHCVIISEDTQRYLHCHPEMLTAAPATDHRDGPVVTFHTIFPEPGRYKVWGQFKRGDEIIVADFVVEVDKPLLPHWLAKALIND